MDSRVSSAARTAEQSGVVRALARGGYVASGIIHGLIGVIAFAVAWSGRGRSDQAGALETISAAPLGFAAVWTIAALLWALGVYHGAHGFALWMDSKPRRWMRRLAEWSQAALFLFMGFVAAAVAIGARPNPDESAQDASRGLLTIPGGPILLGLIGAGVAVGGVAWVVMGLRRSFRQHVTLPTGLGGTVIAALGLVGFGVKGAALLVVGVLLITAAVQQDPDAAGGFDAAIESLRALPFGEAVVVAMGVGFSAYGIFCIFRARYADL